MRRKSLFIRLAAFFMAAVLGIIATGCDAKGSLESENGTLPARVKRPPGRESLLTAMAWGVTWAPQSMREVNFMIWRRCRH